MLVIVFLSIVAFANEAHKIEIPSRIRVHGEGPLRLGDLLDEEFTTSSQGKNLAKLAIGNKPKSGERLILTSEALSSILRPKTANHRQLVQFRIPPEVTVESGSSFPTPEAIEEDLKLQWKTRCGDCRILFSRLKAPSNPGVEVYSWNLKVAESLPKGPFSVPLEIVQKNGEAQVLWVQGSIEIRRRVPVLLRAVPFGERITGDDVKFEWRDTTFAFDEVPNLDQFESRKLKRSMVPGDVLWSHILEKNHALKRGDIVKVQLGEGHWQIISSAIAEQDGQVGDTVKLRNLKSQKFIQGKVTGEGEVQVQ